MKTFLEARFGKLDATGKFWMWAGIVTLICSMGMAYDYGSQVTWKHGLVMGALSFATAFLIEEAYSYWKRGLTGVALGLTIVSIPMFWQESKSHIAYTAGFRGASVQAVHVQNVKYDAAQDRVKENRDNLAALKTELAELKAKNGWAPTVTADGLRAEVTAMEGDQVFKRSKGCADVTRPDSRAFCDKRADLQGKIATAERYTSLQTQIANLQVQVDTYRDKAATVEHKTSVVEHQTDLLVKVAGLLFKGDTKATPMLAEGVDLENTVMLALMPVILPALCFFMMGLRREESSAAPAAFAGFPAAPSFPQLPAPKAEPTSSSTYLINSTDPSVAAKLAALRDAFAKVGKPA